MSTGIAVALIVLGVVVLLFGRRLALLAAGVGALLGVGLLQFLPGQQDGIVGLLLVFGLAILGGILGFFAKGLTHLIIIIIGFIAGGALVLAGLDALAISLGLMAFVVACLAGLVGAALTMRGLQLVVPSLVGWVGLLIGVALAVLGIVYQSRRHRD